MSFYKEALLLAIKGFHIFPLDQNKKIPLAAGFNESASFDKEDIEKMWLDPITHKEFPYNIGISTSKFRNNQALLVIDVDNKDGKNGSETILKLELEGNDFPKTCTQTTPTGGKHLIYKIKEPIKQTVGLFGKKSGIDTRSRGGYIVGAGSIINGKAYTIDDHEVVDAPQWLIDKCLENAHHERKAAKEIPSNINQNTAMKRAKEYLLELAEWAVQGAGGDHTTYVVASKMKDFGVSVDNALELMLDHWNEKCQPPWNPDELLMKIDNAYAYGQNRPGIDSPEADFDPIEDTENLDPIEKLNKEFAFIVLGGRSTVLRRDDKGKVSYMNPQAFHDILKAEKIQTAKGSWVQLSKLWYSSPKRPTYYGAEMFPLQQPPKGIYNLWKGFKCEPLKDNEKPTKEMLEGVKMFKDYTLENICNGDENLYKWIMGYFAHLIQRPWEKPLTALVFIGEKGVGKNAFIGRIGNLFNGHCKLTSSKRYLISNFNGHLANLLMFVLDEAVWSGDKQAEGILKDLITGDTHLIEHKGRDMYSVKNLLRVVIMSNEDWAVPATKDERRFAIFNVNNNRQGNIPFFSKMIKLIDHKGGNRLLLKELMDFDLSQINVNIAPKTEGLLQQKIESLNPCEDWWYSCLREGSVLGLDFTNDWPRDLDRKELRNAYIAYTKQRGIRSWLLNSSAFGKKIKLLCPELDSKRLMKDGSRNRIYLFPPLTLARKAFEKYIRHNIEWEIIEDGDEPHKNNDSNLLDASGYFR